MMVQRIGRPLRVRWALAIAILVWTAIAWGGRVTLLAGGEGLWAWARIAGSIAIGVVVAGTLVTVAARRWERSAVVLFALWSVGLWARSLVVNWAGDGSLAFKLVHTVLAVGFFTLAWLSLRVTRSTHDL